MKLAKFRTYWLVGFLAVPLLYLPDLQSDARLWRLWLWAALVVIGLVLQRKQMRQFMQALPKPARVLICLALAGMLLTWFVALFSKQRIAYVGVEPEYLGWIAWLAAILSPLAIGRHIHKQLFAPAAQLVIAAGLCLSLGYGLFYVRHGLALAGVLYQPTALAIYANIGVLISIWQQGKNRSNLQWCLLILNVLSILISQSRLGFILLVANLVICSYYSADLKRVTRLILRTTAITAVLLPIIAPGYFATLRAQDVPQGLSYTARLYDTTGTAVVVHHPLYGHGPSSLPRGINNQNFVPEDIAKSLDKQTRFSANHSLFFDVGYFFGGVTGLSLLGLSGLGVYIYARHYKRISLEYFLIFTTLLVSAIFALPSLELTGLYLIVLFGLLRMGAES